MNFTLLGAVFASYLIGAIPFGLVLSRLMTDRDPREHGSGNIGATNAMRTGGKTVGILTLVADIAKSLLPVGLAVWMDLPEIWIAAIATATFVGHLYPVYLGFKGGKGVATMLGAMLPWQPLAAGIGFFLWLVLIMISRYVSLSSVIAALVLPFLVWWTGGSIPALIVSMIFASLVTLKHASNIRRLIDGTEPAIGKDRKASPDA
ncbi:glycerol-3-phosphate acyltransferase PlsY [Mariprofundus micogutta]|uniref:Glycerol-3-phosphate acyltransferase n=1 Tax=Mariprofundus micogutta TaxID=1921010 RepID=A0A1L8CQZ5_9PROT|nr:glycerol-3-phosphate 1-O-acyltransferase PlsY [Mariprofundus micogutta]GAV21332.1 glycerol-3-phosphate acyltransferase PlsY [Mariprofundus micogutta]